MLQYTLKKRVFKGMEQTGYLAVGDNGKDYILSNGYISALAMRGQLVNAELNKKSGNVEGINCDLSKLEIMQDPEHLKTETAKLEKYVDKLRLLGLEASMEPTPYFGYCLVLKGCYPEPCVIHLPEYVKCVHVAVSNPNVKITGGKGLLTLKEAFSGNMFLGHLDLSDTEISGVLSMNRAFQGCGGLKRCNLSGIDSSKVTSMHGMFKNCWSLTEVTFGGKFDTSSCNDFSDMFCRCDRLRDLDLTGIDTSKATDISGMFNGCHSIHKLDLSTFNTSRVTNMEYLFRDCKSLKDVYLYGFDTSRCRNMSCMFNNCKYLQELDLNHFDVSQVSRAISMFDGCVGLDYLGIDKWNLSNLRFNKYMFTGVPRSAVRDAESLKVVQDRKSWLTNPE